MRRLGLLDAPRKRNQLSQQRKAAQMVKASAYLEMLKQDPDLTQSVFIEAQGWEWTENTDSAIKQLQRAVKWTREKEK